MTNKITALKLRHTLGGVLKRLATKKEPLIIEKNKDPVAVLIPYETFKNRFVDFQEKVKINEIINKFKSNLAKSKNDSISLLRDLRYGDDN